MKIKSLALATAFSLTSGLAMANSYQAEVGASYTDVENGDGVFGMYGEFHFSPVQTRNHPLAEAAFLERSSNVYAAADDDFDALTVGGELYVPDTMFYVGGRVTRVDNAAGDETTAYATLGLTPVDGLLVTTEFSEDGYDANISAKYVTSLGGGNFVNLEGTYQDTDFDDDILSLGADFYFDRTWSVGAGYTDFLGDDQFTLRTEKFFTNEISGRLSFTDSDAAGNVFTIGGAVRF
ncbi:putative porin [Marinimicrobium koreense]|uniref:Putative general porin n=1 Tax=Marinimicrobium koreense TaxID=306545 RepID=A0A3N1NQ53_9GAMM|nr:putative porin [Marinimicrobium koreense]ROQ20992.1 putative general porin [Marinimicrobium koreense]